MNHITIEYNFPPTTAEEQDLLNRMHSLFLIQKGLHAEFMEFLAQESTVQILQEYLVEIDNKG